MALALFAATPASLRARRGHRLPTHACTLRAWRVMATVPNFELFEFSFGEVPWRAEIVDPPERIEKGALILPERPGLGYTINDKLAARYAV